MFLLLICHNRGRLTSGRGGGGRNERKSARVGRVCEAQLKIPQLLKLTFICGECDRVIETREVGEGGNGKKEK